jgi:hypothetical protein
MENIVAIRVTDAKGKRHFFLTWGRIFDSTKTDELFIAIKPHLQKFGVKGASKLYLCESLREAAQQKYFFEAFFELSQEKISFGIKTYPKWKAKQKARIKNGKGIYYLGTD